MKIAFCFLTRADLLQPAVWESFFDRVARETYNVYCHPKEPAGIVSSTLRGRVIDSRVATRHGDVSIVEATLALLSAAFRDDADNEYFILLSESTIPIRPFRFVHEQLVRCEQRSVIRYGIPPPHTEHYKRLLTIENWDLFSTAFYYHEQWVILHRRHLGLLLDQPCLDLFAKAFAPDEHYFMNVLVHVKGVPLSQIINRRATFTNWTEKKIRRQTDPATGQVMAQTVHPKTYSTLSAADIAQARKEKCLFFRKVSELCDCRIILDALAP